MKILFNIVFIVSIALYATGCQASGGMTCADAPQHPTCDTSKINTAGWEDSPYITPDGDTLYFAFNPYNFMPMFKGGQPKHVGPNRPGSRYSKNPFDSSETYVSVRDGGVWSAPELVPLQTKRGSCCAMPSEDGKRMYFQDIVPQVEGGPEINTDIVIAEKDRNGNWKMPQPVGGSINSPFIEDNPHITADEKTMLWVSERPGGFGKKDIWIASKNDDGSWGEAHNLGAAVNTDENEDQPWVNPEGNEIYFNREISIYHTKVVNGQWSKAKPVKFEKPVIGAEVSLTADGEIMYLMLIDPKQNDIIVSVSQRKSDGTWSYPVPVD